MLAQVPELDQGASDAACQQRLSGRQSLILVAAWQEQLVGFKVGYALGPQDFYSWLGGVVPGFRKRRLAASLLQAQEQWAVHNGYRRIQVKSHNRFPAMLQLLAAQGYRQCAPAAADGKLLLRKVLR